MPPTARRAVARAAATAIAALLLTGCVAGDTKDNGGDPQRNLAVRPSSLAPVPTDTVAPTASGSPGGSAGSGSPGAPGGSPGETGGASATSGPGAPAAPYHQVGVTPDRANDAGATTPAYADAVAVSVEDNGTNARITVTMRGTVPARLPAEETMGVGVDFYSARTNLESDFQVFADGEPDGWYAYLQTPKGKVKYPGTFGIGGRRLVFTVPWSAIGGRRSGFFSAFADWTRTATPANLAGEDHAPDLGYASYDR